MMQLEPELEAIGEEMVKLAVGTERWLIGGVAVSIVSIVGIGVCM